MIILWYKQKLIYEFFPFSIHECLLMLFYLYIYVSILNHLWFCIRPISNVDEKWKFYFWDAYMYVICPLQDYFWYDISVPNERLFWSGKSMGNNWTARNHLIMNINWNVPPVWTYFFLLLFSPVLQFFFSNINDDNINSLPSKLELELIPKSWSVLLLACR